MEKVASLSLSVSTKLLPVGANRTRSGGTYNQDYIRFLWLNVLKHYGLLDLLVK